MAVRKILRIGHPQLRLAAKAVERVGGETLSALVNDMLDTMQAFRRGGIGRTADRRAASRGDLRD